MKIEFTLVEVGENEALVTLEAEDWVVAIPATLADPKVTIDTDILESPSVAQLEAENERLREALEDMAPLKLAEIVGLKEGEL